MAWAPLDAQEYGVCLAPDDLLSCAAPSSEYHGVPRLGRRPSRQTTGRISQALHACTQGTHACCGRAPDRQCIRRRGSPVPWLVERTTLAPGRGERNSGASNLTRAWHASNRLLALAR